MSSKVKTVSKKAQKEEEEKKALAKAKKAAAGKKAAKPAKKGAKKPIKKSGKKPLKKVRKAKKGKKLVKKAIKKIVKKEVALTDENGAYTDAGWAAQAIVHAKAQDKKYVKLPVIKTWLKANCDKAQGAGSTVWLNKHLLSGIAKLVKGKLVGQLSWGFAIRHLGEEKILGKVFPKKAAAKKAPASKAAPGKKDK